MSGRAGCYALLMVLAACGSSPKGGYYKDDGPGAQQPSASTPDAVPRLEPLHRFANRPYEVFGRSYVPHASLKAFRQQGLASWYGKRFHGSKTSSGEVYDMYRMTAAHPTLAIPSYARVTNLANGRSVVVRINDRGPFHGGRIIDLSYAAATKLGYVQAGSARVEVEAIVP
jgi:rare lipoprotein A